MEPGVAATYAEVPAGTLRNVRTHARLSAPLAKGRHPVVILATGGIEPRSIYTLYAEELAARGFVVATVDHTDEARAVVFPDGRIAGPAEIPTTIEETVDWVPRAVAVRVADTRFLLDRLERLRGLDLRRVGMVGHSLGGSTAAEVMLADSRIDAGVNLDGLITPAPIAQGLDRPFMVINVAATPPPPGWPFSEGYTRGPGSLWENLRGPRYSLTLDGAAHMDFSDLAIWKAQIDAPAFREANDLGPIDSAAGAGHRARVRQRVLPAPPARPSRPAARRPVRGLPRDALRPLERLQLGVDDLVEQPAEIPVERLRPSVRILRVERQLLIVVGDVEHRAEDQPQRVDGLHPGVQLLRVQDLGIDRRLDEIHVGEPALLELVVREPAVLVLLLRVVGVGGRVQPADPRIGAVEREQLAQLAEQLPDQLALAGVELELVAPVAQDARGAAERPRQSCLMVAHRPCSCRRKTSSSAFSRVPEETTARPLWCTSSISSVALARL